MIRKITFATLSAIALLAGSVHASASQKTEIVASINQPWPDPSGIAVSSDNRIFVGFPRHEDNHDQFALAEVIKGQLTPYPDTTLGRKHNGDFAKWLVSPHGMWIDAQDRLWVLDDGKLSGSKTIPAGAAKVVAIDTRTNKVVRTLLINKPVLRSSAHYNDLRVDLSHGSQGTVYIANSGFEEDYSLIVIDVASGRQREVLHNQPATSPDPGFIAFLEGQPLKYDTQHKRLPMGGIDGLALTPDNKKLFWTSLSGRRLFSIDTSVISNFDADEQQVERAVTFEGQHPPVDGLAEDDQGNIYMGAFEQQSLVARDPAGNYRVILHDAKNLTWPDGLAWRNHYLYVTLGQWNRVPGLNNGKDLRQRPYLILRTRTDD